MNGRFSLLLLISCRSHTEPITMSILSMFHTIVSRKLKSQIRIQLVTKTTSAFFLFCFPSDMIFSLPFYVGYDIFSAVLRRMTFSGLFYVGYDIFCSVLRRIWHFLFCFTSGTTFSVLFYVGYDIFSAVLRRIWHFLCCFTSHMAFSIKMFPLEGFLLNV